MKQIAFLGLGAMGSRMASKLISAGHDVVAWNRSVERAEAFAEGGATIAGSPRAAAVGADIVISMVRDDEASRQIWLDQESGALQAMGRDALAIECSTLSVPFVEELAAAFGVTGRAFVDAPLAGSRPQADAGQLTFFVGGRRERFDRAKSILEPMAGAVHHAGETGAGATIKLMINALFGAQLGVMAELIGFAQKTGIDLASAVEIIGSTPICSPAAKASAGAMIAGAWAPAFPIDLVAKDFRLLDQSASSVTAAIPLSVRTGEIYTKGVSDGIGGDNITGIAQLYAQLPT